MISTALSFATSGNPLSWGGAVGEYSSGWLMEWTGNIGTAAILVMAVFSYIIWRFNPVFRLPKLNNKHKQKSASTETALTVDDELPITKEWDDDVVESTEGGILLIDHEIQEPTSQNRIKNEGKSVAVIMPHGPEAAANPMNEFGIVEKEGQGIDDATVIEPAIHQPANRQPIATRNPHPETRNSDLELEINEVTEIEERRKNNRTCWQPANKI